jgi:hypothetical protein
MGRHPSGKVPNQPLGIIMSKHREIMRRLVAGETQHRIAVEMGMTESRLSIICNSPLFKRELAALEAEVKGRYITTTADIQAKINQLQPRAVDILDQILNKTEVDGKSVSLPLKRDVALDVLELAGSGKKKNATVADAMGDVVKIIADGFKLAKELKEASVVEEQHAASQRQNSRILHPASCIQLSNSPSSSPYNGHTEHNTIISSGVSNINTNASHNHNHNHNGNLSYPTAIHTSDMAVDNVSVNESPGKARAVTATMVQMDTPDGASLDSAGISADIPRNIAPTIVNMEDTEYTISDVL